MARECRFCEIVAHEHAAEIVHEDDLTVTFLDHAPLARGHLLVIPRMHFETLLDVPPVLLASTFTRVQSVSRALMRALGVEGVMVVSNAVVHQTVPHFHVHIVPRVSEDTVRGFTSEEAVGNDLHATAGEIRTILDGSGAQV